MNSLEKITSSKKSFTFLKAALKPEGDFFCCSKLTFTLMVTLTEIGP